MHGCREAEVQKCMSAGVKECRSAKVRGEGVKGVNK